MMKPSMILFLFLAAISCGKAQTVDYPFSEAYQITKLGNISTIPGIGIPWKYGGIAFQQADPNKLLICGDANRIGAQIFEIEVMRGSDFHIIGFKGNASVFANNASFCDGGLAWNDDVLFYTIYPVGDNNLSDSVGQIKNNTNKISHLNVNPLNRGGGLQFVPATFPGNGSLKVLYYAANNSFYNVQYERDQDGFFDLTLAEFIVELDAGRGDIQFAYVPENAPFFSGYSSLVNDYGSDSVTAYDVDQNGNLIKSSARGFITGLSSPVGAVFDPITNDLLLSTFDPSELFIVQGFTTPSPTPPPPSPTPPPPTRHRIKYHERRQRKHKRKRKRKYHDITVTRKKNTKNIRTITINGY